MHSLMILTTIAALTFGTISFILFLRYRKRLHKNKIRKKNLLIPAVALENIHSCFTKTRLGYSLDCEVHFLGRTADLLGATTDTEGYILSVLAKQSQFIFEFGTCSGKTTYLLARNSPNSARIVTLTLPLSKKTSYEAMELDTGEAALSAINESAFEKFVYSGTTVENKIVQLFEDSKLWDESEFRGVCDLIFIDGSHAYSYIKNDTEKALRMLKKGGLIVWHDYGNTIAALKGVMDYLHELQKNLPLTRIEGTSLVMYRS